MFRYRATLSRCLMWMKKKKKGREKEKERKKGTEIFPRGHFRFLFHLPGIRATKEKFFGRKI